MYPAGCLYYLWYLLPACFLIGSSFGMAPRIKEKADFKLSMGPMTFPHHLARIMVLEQIYRAEAIQAGSKYHK